MVLLEASGTLSGGLSLIAVGASGASTIAGEDLA